MFKNAGRTDTNWVDVTTNWRRLIADPRQLNALLTALTQTNFNGVNIFIARLCNIFFFSLAQNKEAVA
jgi:hypothetical protein